MVARACDEHAMRYRISHRTTYSYETPVVRSFHVLHLRPAPSPHQTVLNHGILIEPAPVHSEETVDYFGNHANVLCIDEAHKELVIHSHGTIDVRTQPARDLTASCPWEQVGARARDANGIAIDVMQFVCPSRQTPDSAAVRQFAEISFVPGRPVLVAAMDMTTRIYREFKFDATATEVSTPVERVLSLRRGVCQDFAHLSLTAFRAMRVPARYVSGYLLTRPPPGQARLRGVDASHAWISVWAPETGWVDFDPTNGVIPHGEHITVATGRDYDDVCPISGVLLGGQGQSMTVGVDVEPLGDETAPGE